MPLTPHLSGLCFSNVWLPLASVKDSWSQKQWQGSFSGLRSLQFPIAVRALWHGGIALQWGRGSLFLASGLGSDPGTGVTEALGHSQGTSAGVWGAQHCQGSACFQRPELGLPHLPVIGIPVPSPWSSLFTTFLSALLSGLVAPRTLRTAVKGTWEASGASLACGGPA